jgi:hypothetical protein
VAVVSKEPERLWAQRRDDLEIGDHVRVVIAAVPEASRLEDVGALWLL